METKYNEHIQWMKQLLGAFVHLPTKEQRLVKALEIMDCAVRCKDVVIFACKDAQGQKYYAQLISKLIQFVVQNKLMFLPHLYELSDITPPIDSVVCYMCGKLGAHCLPCGHFAHYGCLEPPNVWPAKCPYFFCKVRFDKEFFIDQAKRLCGTQPCNEWG